MLSTVIQTTIIDSILREWRSLTPAYHPQGVWIREYAPIVNAKTDFNSTTLPNAVWFANAQTISPRSIWQWQRLYTVHFIKPWCWLSIPPMNNAPFGKRYELGLAAFAPIIDSTDVYVETMWGGLFGRGWQVEIDAQQRICNSHMLWVS